MNLHYFIVIQGCPVYADIGPYIQMCLDPNPKRPALPVNSIYRGANAEYILNHHGKLSQAQLYYRWINRWPGYLPANPPGFSSHELKSDGIAYPGIARGENLEWWMQGFDVNDSDVDRIKANAKIFGWELFQPYHSGTEYHHLNFLHRPKRPAIGSANWMRMVRIRATYPRT